MIRMTYDSRVSIFLLLHGLLVALQMGQMCVIHVGLNSPKTAGIYQG